MDNQQPQNLGPGNLHHLILVLVLIMSAATLFLSFRHYNFEVAINSSSAFNTDNTAFSGLNRNYPAIVNMVSKSLAVSDFGGSVPTLLLDLGNTGGKQHSMSTTQDGATGILNDSILVIADKNSSMWRDSSHDVCCKGTEAGKCSWRSASNCSFVCGNECGVAPLATTNVPGAYMTFVVSKNMLYTVSVDTTVTPAKITITSVSPLNYTSAVVSTNSQAANKILMDYKVSLSKTGTTKDSQDILTDINTYIASIAGN